MAIFPNDKITVEDHRHTKKQGNMTKSKEQN